MLYNAKNIIILESQSIKGINMKKLILAVSILISTNALAATDYTCVSNCTSSGYMYGYCQSKCSYNTNTFGTQKRTDYSCVNNCTSKGYLYGYCKSQCSY